MSDKYEISEEIHVSHSASVWIRFDNLYCQLIAHDTKLEKIDIKRVYEVMYEVAKKELGIEDETN